MFNPRNKTVHRSGAGSKFSDFYADLQIVYVFLEVADFAQLPSVTAKPSLLGAIAGRIVRI